MKQLIMLVACIICMPEILAQVNWGSNYNGGTTSDQAYFVTTDASGNVYVIGTESNGSDLDAVIIKYNSSGSQSWAVTWSAGSTNDIPVGIGVDDSGNVYGALNRDTGRPTIRKYNSSGTSQWVGNLATTGSELNKIYVDGSGNLYGVGKYISSGIDNGWVVKFNASGSKKWESWWDGDIDDGLVYNDLFVENSKVWVVGTETVNSETHLFIGEYSDGASSTALDWDTNLGTVAGTDEDLGLAIRANPVENKYVVMAYNGTGNSASGYRFYEMTTSNSSLGHHDLTTSGTFTDFDFVGDEIALATTSDLYFYNSAFSEDWSVGIPVTGNSMIAVDGNDDFFVGYGTTTLNFKKYSKYGHELESKSSSSANADNFTGIALNNEDAPVLIGYNSDIHTTEFCTPPTVSFSSGEEVICEGSSVQITATVTSGSTYQWQSASGIDDVNSLTPTFSEAGTYVLDVTKNSCSTSRSITVTEDQVPPQTIYANGNLINSGDDSDAVIVITGSEDATLRGNFQAGASLTQYEWYDIENPGFGEISFNADEITVDEPGTYYAEVSWDKNSCILTSTHLVYVLDGDNPNEYYWVGGSGNWSDPDHWATSSGGSTKYTRRPLRTDNVYFDANSFSSGGQTVTLDIDGECKDLDWASVSNSPFFTGPGQSMDIYGSLTLSNTMTLNTIDYNFLSDGNETISTNGFSFGSGSFDFLGTGSWTFMDETNVFAIGHANGSIDFNDQSFSVGHFDFNVNNYTLDLGGAYFDNIDTWNTTGASNLTVIPGTSTLRFNSSTDMSFQTNGDNYYDLIVADATNKILTITGDNSFNTITLEKGASVDFGAGDTQTFGDFIAIGTTGNEIDISSSSGGTKAYLTSTVNQTYNGKKLVIQDIGASGATFNAQESTDNGNNTGWNFTADNVDPVVTSSVSNIQSNYPLTEFDLHLEMNENGTVFYVVIEEGTSVPSSIQVTNGQDGAGQSALESGSVTVEPFEEYITTIAINDNNAGIKYDVYVVGEDDASSPNLENSPTKIDVDTPDLQPAILNSSGTSNLSPTGMRFSYTMSESGTLYYVLIGNNVAQPSVSQVLNGVDGNNQSPVRSGSVIISSGQAGTGQTLDLTGLVASSHYDFYIATEDDADPVNISQTVTKYDHQMIDKYSQSITFSLSGTFTYGDDPFSLSGMASSGLSVTYASSDTDVVTISGTTATIVGAGNVTITASQAGDGDYEAATDVDQAITVDKASQTITFSSISDQTFGATDIILDATATSGFTISYSSDNTDAATVAANVLSIVGAGSVTITASQPGNENYEEASSVDQSFTVNQASQTITFGELDDKTFGDAPFDLMATASSGLTITYSSSNTDVATISGSTVTIAGAGSSTITASQPGNENYEGASDVQQSLTVLKADQVITFEALESKEFTDDPFDLGATATSGLTVSYTSSNTNVATISGATVTIVGTGSTTITASQNGDSDYNAALLVDQVFTVTLTNQSITFESLTDRTFGDPDFTLTATASSGLPVSYASSDPSVATVTDGTVTITGAGSTTITASQPGNSNFEPAADIDQTLVVNKADQSITFSSLEDVGFGESDFQLMGTASSGLTVSYHSSDDDIVTVSENTVSIVGAGTATITASQAGNSNYHAAEDVNRQLIVNQASQSIDFGALEEKTFGDGEFDLSATASSGLDVNFSSSDESVATIEGSTVTVVGAGSATITASQSGDNNYSAAVSIDHVLVVNKASQEISFETLADVDLTEVTEVVLSASATSGLSVAFDIISGPATLTGSTLTLTEPGTVTVLASQPGDGNYEAAESIEHTFNVTEISKADQIITFGELEDRTFGDADFEITASSSSNLTVVFTSSDGSVIEISGNMITILGAGTVTIIASQAGNDSYNPAVSVEQILTILPAEQSISFAELDVRTYGDEDFELDADASSGLPVTFSSSDESIAEVDGTTLTITGAGTVDITAAQEGNTNYQKASEVTRELIIDKANQVISFDAVEDVDLANAEEINLSAASSSGLEIVFEIVSGPAVLEGATISFSETGTVVVSASQPGNSNYNAAESVEQSIQVFNSAKTDQTISFESIGGKTFGDEDFQLEATSSSGLEVSFESSNNEVATLDANIVSIAGAGSTIITAFQEGNDTFNPAEPVRLELIVNKADQTISFDPIPDFDLAKDEPISLSATATSGLEVSYEISGPATLEGNVLTPTGPGTVTVTVSQSGNKNYLAADQVTVSFEVVESILGLDSNHKPSIYPNPTDGTIKIEGLTAGAKIKIYELSGKAILQTGYNGQELNLDQLKKGNYIIRTADKGQTTFHRVVIKR